MGGSAKIPGGQFDPPPPPSITKQRPGGDPRPLRRSPRPWARARQSQSAPAHWERAKALPRPIPRVLRCHRVETCRTVENARAIVEGDDHRDLWQSADLAPAARMSAREVRMWCALPRCRAGGAGADCSCLPAALLMWSRLLRPWTFAQCPPPRPVILRRGQSVNTLSEDISATRSP